MNISSLERQLAGFAGRKGAVLVGHANTAFYLTLQYIRQLRGPGDVLVSPIVCPSFVQTIVYAGFRPVFVDVQLPLCTIDPTAAAKAIGPDTRAIVGIHIFGHSADMPKLAALAEQHDVWLIEDAAQSLGGSTADRRHGGWGQVSLYSFAGTKIVSAGGGGALLSDDEKLLAHARNEAAQMPALKSDSDFQLLSLSHRNLTHGVIDALRVQRDAPGWRAFTGLLDAYRPLVLHSFPDDARLTDAISLGLERIDDELHERSRRAAAYRSGLSGLTPMLQVPGGEGSSGAVWRFTAIVAEQAKAVSTTKALRDAGLHASNHYWSVAELMYGKRDLPNSDFASPRFLNLWVERSVPMANVERAVEIIGRALKAAS
ncbi:MAG TPA: DegT/DnrJ/EryC1/StrS family aminotransferase [Pseudolabrys sp.]|jgi:dTDP-4-amino-4,6-dideoxygalactose transaminase|nr:DegT/DnrJ/EryC1/StrS family aminotransferase [Pseudolabrys sp.]